METERSLLLIGGGGHCRSIVDSIVSAGMYKKIGIIDNDKSARLSGIPLIGNDDDLPKILCNGWTDAFISVGSMGPSGLRQRLYEMVKNYGLKVPAIIDYTAVVAADAEINEGVFIGKRAVVNTGSKIGKCAILNTGSVTEHDCEIGEFAHISPGAILCGHVIVGDNSHIGAGSVIRQGIIIGKESLIGAGSVVVKDIPCNAKAYGNPCKVAE